MAKSKIIVGGEVYMDLTQDTIKPDKVLRGYTGHGADGEPFVGECDFDTNTSDVTTLPAEVLEGKPFGRGGKIEYGTMPNRAAEKKKISSKDEKVAISQGYHDGSGYVEIDDAEKAKLIPENIPAGMTMFGVAGTRTGLEGVNAQSREVTASFVDQTVLPEEGYNYLTEVKIKAIPIVETDNAAGGKTVTIG